MKKLMMVFVVLCIMIGACSKEKDQSVKLEPGTEAYQLAVSISEKLPYFDPDANNVLAKGKGIKITTGTVIEQLHLFFGKSSGRLLSARENQLRNIIQSNLEEVVNQNLLINKIEKTRLNISESELDSVMQLNYDRAGGEEQFMTQLENNNISVDQVIEDMKNRLLINKYFDEKFGQDVIPTEQEVIDRYNQDKTASVRHILFLTQGKSDSMKQETRKKAEEVLAMAKSGADFEKLVKKYSEDPGSNEKGGLYQDFKRGDMVKPFEEASFTLPVDSISDLVETQYGYHIIKVIDRKKETLPLEEVRDKLMSQIENERKNEIFKQHIEELKLEAAVEYAPF
ncbi:peptidylprolyl isomerase [bacterium]|nr:peptidylprolyl isomerase [bacterium]